MKMKITIMLLLNCPGVDIKELSITATQATLSIEGERKPSVELKDVSYHLNERTFGAFKRSLSLDKKIDTSKVTAKLNNGILVITLAKAEEEKPKHVSVKIG